MDLEFMNSVFRRGYGARGLCMDNLLNADAFFMTVVPVWNSATVRSQVICYTASGRKSS
jgi:hypothetical protein